MTTSFNRLAQGAFILGSARVFEFFIGLLKFKIGAVFLGVSGFGVFNQANFLSNKISILTTLSINEGLVKQIADIPAISVNPKLNNSKHSGLKAFSEGFGKEGAGAGGSIISSMLKTGNDSAKFLNLAEKEYDRL